MINISLTEQELQALMMILDAGQKALGLQASRACVVLQDRIDAAVKAANEAKEQG